MAKKTEAIRLSLTKKHPGIPRTTVDDLRRCIEDVRKSKSVRGFHRAFIIFEICGCSAEDAAAYRAELKPDSVPTYVNGVFTFREDDMPELN